MQSSIILTNFKFHLVTNSLLHSLSINITDIASVIFNITPSNACNRNHLQTSKYFMKVSFRTECHFTTYYITHQFLFFRKKYLHILIIDWKTIQFYPGYAGSVYTNRQKFNNRLSNKPDRGRQLALLAISLTAARGKNRWSANDAFSSSWLLDQVGSVLFAFDSDNLVRPEKKSHKLSEIAISCLLHPLREKEIRIDQEGKSRWEWFCGFLIE